MLKRIMKFLSRFKKESDVSTQKISSEETVADIIDRDKAKEMVGDIIIPDSMDEIGYRLFEENKNITSVTILGTVKKIGDRAFADCENLETVILNEGIEEIESNVFTGCKKLKHVVYPDSVKKYDGETFYKTNLSDPVFNVSKTILIFCPESVSGQEWTVPETVKIISQNAFVNHKNLEILHLPDGLEIIQDWAFRNCGLHEITIPYSVKEICSKAFWYCDQLEKVTILNPNTKIFIDSFGGCRAFNEINCESLTESDKIFHLKGQTLLIKHLESPANLNHQDDPEFKRLTANCAKGDADSMNDLAIYFEKLSHESDASPFYIYASNYWRYRAYRGGNSDASKWFKKFFADHPNEHLDSILPENNNPDAGWYTHSIPGILLNDLGFEFFDPERNYEIKHFENEKIVEVSAFESFEGPDEDGFGAETYYDWWFLDENMQPIPGIEKIIATTRERDQSYFIKTRARALEIVNER